MLLTHAAFPMNNNMHKMARFWNKIEEMNCIMDLICYLLKSQCLACLKQQQQQQHFIIKVQIITTLHLFRKKFIAKIITSNIVDNNDNNVGKHHQMCS